MLNLSNNQLGDLGVNWIIQALIKTKNPLQPIVTIKSESDADVSKNEYQAYLETETIEKPGSLKMLYLQGNGTGVESFKPISTLLELDPQILLYFDLPK